MERQRDKARRGAAGQNPGGPGGGCKMVEFLGDALGSILSGGATGLLGSALTMFGEMRKQKMVQAHEAEMERLAQASMKLEASLELERARTEAQAAQDIEAAKAFTASYDHDKRAYLTGKLGTFGRGAMGTVDFLRGIVRPVVTFAMIWMVYKVYSRVDAIIGGLEALPKDELVSIYNQIVLAIIYIGVTVVLWWFGTRTKPLSRR